MKGFTSGAGTVKSGIDGSRRVADSICILVVEFRFYANWYPTGTKFAMYACNLLQMCRIKASRFGGSIANEALSVSSLWWGFTRKFRGLRSPILVGGPFFDFLLEVGVTSGEWRFNRQGGLNEAV